MHVQQAEAAADAEASGLKAAPRNRTCNNTTHQTDPHANSLALCVCVRVCWCCCAITCKDVAEEAAIAAEATSSPQSLSLSLSAWRVLVCV